MPVLLEHKSHTTQKFGTFICVGSKKAATNFFQNETLHFSNERLHLPGLRPPKLKARLACGVFI
jgi:hypothetical protein